MSIRNPRAESLAREAARRTGRSMTDAIILALEDYLARLKSGVASGHLAEELLAIGRRSAALPDLDSRSADQVLGYAPDGTFEKRRRRGR